MGHPSMVMDILRTAGGNRQAPSVKLVFVGESQATSPPVFPSCAVFPSCSRGPHFNSCLGGSHRRLAKCAAQRQATFCLYKAVQAATWPNIHLLTQWACDVKGQQLHWVSKHVYTANNDCLEQQVNQ